MDTRHDDTARKAVSQAQLPAAVSQLPQHLPAACPGSRDRRTGSRSRGACYRPPRRSPLDRARDRPAGDPGLLIWKGPPARGPPFGSPVCPPKLRSCYVRKTYHTAFPLKEIPVRGSRLRPTGGAGWRGSVPAGRRGGGRGRVRRAGTGDRFCARGSSALREAGTARGPATAPIGPDRQRTTPVHRSSGRRRSR